MLKIHKNSSNSKSFKTLAFELPPFSIIAFNPFSFNTSHATRNRAAPPRILKKPSGVPSKLGEKSVKPGVRSRCVRVRWKHDFVRSPSPPVTVLDLPRGPRRKRLREGLCTVVRVRVSEACACCARGGGGTR